MKSISKVLSMILVVVMCFGLFTTSAFATSMANFDFGGGSNAAQSNTAGGGFDFNPTGSANSASNGSGFDFGGQQSQPVSFDPQPAATTSSDNGISNSVSIGESTGFNTPYEDMGTLPTFTFTPDTISKTTGGDVKVTADGFKAIANDTFPAGYAYSKDPTATMPTKLATANYKIEGGAMTIYGSWLKTLETDTYYFFGLRYDNTPVKLGFVTVTTGNPADYGPFSLCNTTYDKNNSDRASVYVEAMDSIAVTSLKNMDGFGIANPAGTYTHNLSMTEYTRDNSKGTVTISRDYLDSLADGKYYFVGFPTADSTKDQLNFGSFTVMSGNIDIGEVVIRTDTYDKSDAQRNEKAIYARADSYDILMSITGVAISGPVTQTLTLDKEYYRGKNGEGNLRNIVLRPDYLDTLADGTYSLNLTFTSGLTSTQKTIGQFTITSGNVDLGEFIIGNSPYDKINTSRLPVYAQPVNAAMYPNLPTMSFSISGAVNKPLASNEYYFDDTNKIVAIQPSLLDTLPDGTYTFSATAKVGATTVKKDLGSFVITTGEIAKFEISGSPYNKNDDESVQVSAKSIPDGKMTAFTSFSITGVGSISSPRVLTTSEYTVGDTTVKLSKDVLNSLTDGDYYLYGTATVGAITTQVRLGVFTVMTGSITVGTFTVNPDTYDKNEETPALISATGTKEKIMEKMSSFAISTSGSSFASIRTLSASEYTISADKKTITINKGVLDSLADGEYKLLGSITSGTTTQQVTLGTFFVKSGDVETGKYVIGESPYDKNKTDRKEVYVDRTVAADPRFKANSFSIVGVTNTSFSQILNVNQYTANNTTGVISPWITLKKNILDTLPDGNYKIVCSATVGNVNSQVDLGVFTVVSGEVDYGSYKINNKVYDKNDDAAKLVSAEETHGWGMLQYFSGYAISGITNPSYNQVLIGSQYSVNDAKTKVTISESVLKALPDGDYNFLGFATIGQASSQVNFGMFTIKSDYGEFTIQNSPYDKNLDGASPVIATEVSNGAMKRMNGFGVASVNGSYAQPLSVNNYRRSGDGKSVALETRYLDTLEDGQYYLIGFPTLGSTSTQVILGTFTVRSGYYTIGGTAALTPGEQVWYSGSDPLTFYSEIHDLAGKGWNYKPYEWDTIVPDIRVSTYSDMRSPTSVRIDQYWDLNYGYIMLGANYLNSLSAEHTYYMQVIDARHPDILYSDVVSFRVGPTLRALDTDKHVINSTRSLRFRSSEPVARVYVGNIELTDPADFGISWDGRTVTLSFEFLNKRTGGNTYTIKVLTTGGEYASTTFQVLTTAQGSASPRTGDESNLGLWAAFLLLSGTAVVVLVPKLKKHDF